MKKYIVSLMFLLSLNNHLPAGPFQLNAKKEIHPLTQLKENSNKLKEIIKTIPELNSLLQKISPTEIDKKINEFTITINNLITKGQTLLQKIKTDKVPARILSEVKLVAKKLLELQTAINSTNQDNAQKIVSELVSKIPVPLFLIQRMILEAKAKILEIVAKFHQVAPTLILKSPSQKTKTLIQNINKSIDILANTLLDNLLILVNYASMIQLQKVSPPTQIIPSKAPPEKK